MFAVVEVFHYTKTLYRQTCRTVLKATANGGARFTICYLSFSYVDS